MIRSIGKSAILVAAAWVLFVTAAGADPVAGALDQNAALRFSQAVLGQVPGNHTLYAADGRRLSLSQYRGKPLLVHFVYTGCYQVCPTTTRVLGAAIKEAQRALGPDSFHTLTIGFNLPFDTPTAMKAYAQKHGLGLANWDFLSPDAAGVDRLTQEFGFSYAQTPNGFDHVLQVTIVDAEGRIYRQLYGESFDLPLLVEPLKALLTGTPVPVSVLSEWIERVKLLCTVYDPSAGKYRINYAIVIEIFVGASILLVGIGSLINEWRKQRKRSASA
jgi:protein SCO1/2